MGFINHKEAENYPSVEAKTLTRSRYESEDYPSEQPLTLARSRYERLLEWMRREDEARERLETKPGFTYHNPNNFFNKSSDDRKGYRSEERNTVKDHLIVPWF